ncbi:MAG: hypothetical protein OXH52_18475 [Gammaproteobacteria bacterium]|nr:hypothetical protein [Gammaproteobacteria bacterium]
MRMNAKPIARFLPPAFLVRSWPQATMIVCIGCMQMAGDIFDLPVVKALGAASHMSPAPKVFTTQNGFETFSSSFVLHAWDEKHGVTVLRLTPEVNALVRGPYNRRNAYGAALSYGPVLARSPRTAPMFRSVLQFGLCSEQGVAADLGLAGRRHYAVEVAPHDRNPAHESPIRFQVDCETEPVTEDTQ